MTEEDIKALAKEAIPTHPVYQDLLSDLGWKDYINHLRMEWVKGYKAASKEEVLDPMPTEDDFTYGASDASGEVYDQFDRRRYEYELKKWKERNKPKEEVSWDEALGKFKETDKYMPYSTSVTMANYINWLKQNYTLIPKTK
jgi:hypothetical protein